MRDEILHALKDSADVGVDDLHPMLDIADKRVRERRLCAHSGPPSTAGIGKPPCEAISRELNKCRAICSLFGLATGANGANFCRNAFQARFILNRIGNSVQRASQQCPQDWRQ
jgi:hypothetical protein